MNGVHDMGGMDGFGPVAPDPVEPLFHAPWEARALAMTIAAGALGRWSLDASRCARERIAPADYLAMSYYERWIAGLETLLEETGLVSAAELADHRARAPAAPMRVLGAADVPAVLARGAPTTRPGPAATFAVGDRVRARPIHPLGHTRLPRYLRGQIGEVVRLQGSHLLPDDRAEGVETPVPLYQVRFDAAAVFGPRVDQPTSLHADLFEPYLERA